MHSTLNRKRHPVLGWLLVVCSSFLAGFGIYLGRFLRWHSIHIVTNPLDLLRDIAHRIIFPWEHPRTWGVTLGFGIFLILGYLLICVARPAGDLEKQKKLA